MLPFSINDVINKSNLEIGPDVILECFRYQVKNCAVYGKYVELLGYDANSIDSVDKIPFLPIEFFKTKDIYSSKKQPEIIFTSSGTTGMDTSKHMVAEMAVYERSYNQGFEFFYGNPQQYAFLALLPSYLERQGSSLIVMADGLINRAVQPYSGFFLHNHAELNEVLIELKEKEIPTILMGVSFALLDFVEKYQVSFPELIVMETGGMKGRKKEMPRSELHSYIKSAFNVGKIHSEYGMTELLSQAYSQGNGRFRTPPWMKVLIRDVRNPLKLAEIGSSGGINIIDLANIYSCSFIETQDLGVLHSDGLFEIIGRFDQSDIRGCNLMVV